MTPITAEIRAWIDKNADVTELAADEYIDPSDGLIHCKTLRRPPPDRCSLLREIRLFHAPVRLPLSG